MAYLSIRVVCERVGINANTLRAWERRYGIIDPQRSDAGQRRYTEKDVERLQLIVRLVEQGQPIGQLAEASLAELRRLADQSPLDALTPVRLAKECREVLNLLRAFRADEINKVLTTLRKECDARAFVLDVASPLFQEVGRLVAEGKLSFVQEHVLSALMRNHLTYLMASKPSRQKTVRESIAFTTPEGEYHEFGILLGSVLAKHHQFDVQYLGASLPARSIVEVAKVLGTRLLVLGTTEWTRHCTLVPLGHYVKEILDGVQDAEVCLGGPAHLGPTIRLLTRKPVIFSTFQAFDRFLSERRERRAAHG